MHVVAIPAGRAPRTRRSWWPAAARRGWPPPRNWPAAAWPAWSSSRGPTSRTAGHGPRPPACGPWSICAAGGSRARCAPPRRCRSPGRSGSRSASRCPGAAITDFDERVRADHGAGRAVRRGRPAGSAAGRGGRAARARRAASRGSTCGSGTPSPAWPSGDDTVTVAVRDGRRRRLPDQGPLPARLRRRGRGGPASRSAPATPGTPTRGPTSTWCSGPRRWTPTSARPCSTGCSARPSRACSAGWTCDGTWWAILPGIDAGYGAAHAAELITGLAGAPGRA